MGLGVSTEKRSLYDNSFRPKIVSAPPCKNRKQNVSCSRSHRLILWVPPQAERGGCMQGNGLEKESWAHLPFHSSSRPLLSLLADANNRDASEAPMQDRQGSGVAVSHQKCGIFNGDRFPHACCGIMMFMCRRKRRHCQDGRLPSRVISEAEGTKASGSSLASLTFQHYRRARVEMSFAA